LARAFPGNIFSVAGTNHNVTPPTASEFDRHIARFLPRIAYYNEQYNLTDDLPDHLTLTSVKSPPNGVTRAFIALLDADSITTLLTTNDPDEQDRLRNSQQDRANTLASTISKDSNRLVEITLSLTPNGLQITLRTDGKKSFYRQLSDATKYLIAYHIYADQHEPGAILLFDEPSRGLHASAEPYLREFLERLATENHVIVSTHSERLINLDRLESVRLMQQDDQDRLTVLNNLRPPRDRTNYLLALQPVFDAIGLPYTAQVLTTKDVVLTEGLTDYLYIRAFHEMGKTTPPYGITPGRGDATLLTLVPFLASQGVRMKVIIDHPAAKQRLQDAFEIPESAFFLIPATGQTQGVEDIFTTADYQRILRASGYDVTADDLLIGNSAYAKQTNKRLVAQTFRSNVAAYVPDTFELPTQENIHRLLTFCANDDWWRL
jgi:AAA domain, putative AbiEii toxin, Type IV TA system